jgi:hypothetical protein
MLSIEPRYPCERNLKNVLTITRLIINFAMLSAFGHRGGARAQHPRALRRALDSRSGSARLLAVQAHISIKYVGGAGG